MSYDDLFEKKQEEYNIDGSFMCPDDFMISDEAFFNESDKTISWYCQNGHKVTVEGVNFG